MGEIAGPRHLPLAPALPCCVPPRTNPPRAGNRFTCIIESSHARGAGLLALSRAEHVLPLILDLPVAHDGEHGPRQSAQPPCFTAAVLLSATPSPVSSFLAQGHDFQAA